jgi:hypothetical protein
MATDDHVAAVAVANAQFVDSNASGGDPSTV